MSTENESISAIDSSLDELMNMPTVESDEEKKGFFSGLRETDFSLDDLETKKKEETKKEEGDDKEEPVVPSGIQVVTEPEKPSENGTEKKGMYSAIKTLIDDGDLIPFDDDKPMEEYTENDFKELIQANLKEIKRQAEESTPQEFFEQLPQELQVAYQYIQNGGNDIKGLFRALSVSQEISDLNIEDKNGQRNVVRAYLSAINYGSPEEIEEEVYNIEDKGDLEKKAQSYKPKLEQIQNRIINQKVAEQQAYEEQRRKAMHDYAESVYNTLDKDDLNGIHLTKSTKNQLYRGLVDTNYTSQSGRPTNQLYYLLEQYQWVKPNHGLLSEALWLLSDPDGYKSAIGKTVEKNVTEQTVRKLKNEQQGKSNVAQFEHQEERRTIKRPMRNIFS